MMNPVRKEGFDEITMYSTSASTDGAIFPPSSGASSQEEMSQEKIEELGRLRPDAVSPAWREVGFVISIALSQLIDEYLASGLLIILPDLVKDLSIPASSTTWLAAVFSLVASAFVLPFGRVADIYGGFPLYLGGITWTCIWSIVGGFAANDRLMMLCRVMQGLGSAAYLPASLTLLGNVYRPGRRKNFAFSIHSAMAPLGFFAGIVGATLSTELSTWSWYFWSGALLAALTAITACIAIPPRLFTHRQPQWSMDWWGAVCTAAGVLLTVYAITESTSQQEGWEARQVHITLLLGVTCLVAAFFVEGWIAREPLLPFSLFQIRCMSPLLIALFFLYGAVYVYILYVNL